MAADAKVLDEDEATGIKKYRYIKTGVNHFSLAFTYAWLAAKDLAPPFSRKDIVGIPVSSMFDDPVLWSCLEGEDQQDMPRSRLRSSSSDGWV